jgi:hypothetical protein
MPDTRRPLVRAVSLLGAVGLVLAAASPALAQASRGAAVVLPGQDQGAQATRDEFRMVLRQYAPTLGALFRLDPSLMTNEAYLASYPRVVEYLRAHPEIARDPGYYLAFVSQYGDYREPLTPEQAARQSAVQTWNRTFESLILFLVFLTITLTVAWLVKYVVGHRRWLRASRVQSEVHGRLLERFASNEELLAYVQSPAGSRFLQHAPAIDEVAGKEVTAPLGRILWAVQAGLVLVSGGTGLLVIRRYVMEEVGQSLLTIGVLAVSLGIGFALAALASYIISNRLGLVEPPARP